MMIVNPQTNILTQILQQISHLNHNVEQKFNMIIKGQHQLTHLIQEVNSISIALKPKFSQNSQYIQEKDNSFRQRLLQPSIQEQHPFQRSYMGIYMPTQKKYQEEEQASRNSSDFFLNHLQDMQSQRQPMKINHPKIQKISVIAKPQNNILQKQQNSPELSAQTLLQNLQTQFESIDKPFTQWQTLYNSQMGNFNYMPKIIDKDNILLAFQLKTGQVMGAFSQVNFSSKQVLIPRDNPKCFLFNTKNNHCLFVSRTNKSHSRDDRYITFGSWQIKLKVGYMQFESSLGQKGDCFRKASFGGQEVDKRREWLFGELAGNKKFQIEKIAIYALK